MEKLTRLVEIRQEIDALEDEGKGLGAINMTSGNGVHMGNVAFVHEITGSNITDFMPGDEYPLQTEVTVDGVRFFALMRSDYL